MSGLPDGVRLHFNFAGANGWVIEQALVFEWDDSDETDCDPALGLRSHSSKLERRSSRLLNANFPRVLSTNASRDECAFLSMMPKSLAARRGNEKNSLP